MSLMHEPEPHPKAGVPLPIASATPAAATIHGLLGDEKFWQIARAFYARVDLHPRLRPIFPADLQEPIRNQAEFLIQYFGGPQTYSQRKGHPRLRMRHAPYRIDLQARNDWVECMRGALQDAAVPEPIRAEMMSYFERTATFMINQP
jgi:hemoglobin